MIIPRSAPFDTLSAAVVAAVPDDEPARLRMAAALKAAGCPEMAGIVAGPTGAVAAAVARDLKADFATAVEMELGSPDDAEVRPEHFALARRLLIQQQGEFGGFLLKLTAAVRQVMDAHDAVAKAVFYGEPVTDVHVRGTAAACVGLKQLVETMTGPIRPAK